MFIGVPYERVLTRVSFIFICTLSVRVERAPIYVSVAANEYFASGIRPPIECKVSPPMNEHFARLIASELRPALIRFRKTALSSLRLYWTHRTS